MSEMLGKFLATEMSADRLTQLVQLFQHAHVGLVVTDADANITEVNDTACAISGYSRQQLIGRNPSILKSGQHEEAFYREMWAALNQAGFWNGEICNRRLDGILFHEQISIAAVRGADGLATHYVAILSDISRRHAVEEQMRRVAQYDPLTGLPNRLLLADRLERAIAVNRRAETLLAVCFLDLDGFKHINDTLGHEAGDNMLKEVGDRIHSALRSSDTVARLGGDEFVMLLSGMVSEDECCMTLDRLLKVIAEPYALIADTLSEISASIGVTIFPADSEDADTLLRHADQAMYAAKHAGKNCYQLFDVRMEQRIQARQDTLRRVARALRTEQFELHYQPKLDIRQGKVIGAEALIRWNHPVLGSLSPSEFIPLVEDDELAIALGEWVISEALRQGRAWHEQGLDLVISVNAFAKQLQRPNFAEVLARLIEEAWPAMPAGRLMLEIVEHSPSELESMEEVILASHKLGARFSLDDFGTGHSSLSCLRLLTVDEIKIYQGFVHDMLDDVETAALVEGVIGLGQAFGLQVVAEGVESDAHIVRLLELGCNVVQGYRIGYPLPAREFEQWLASFSINPAWSKT
ncbi:MAG: EAL domain-containing protein [Azonexus sp.]|nr:EAL domain-containing protein [Azonexus sp.]